MSDAEHGGERSRMPQVLKELGERAIARHQRRPATPCFQITTQDGKWWFGSPYSAEDEDHWTALLFEAFGTRSQGTFSTFMCQLSKLCSTNWNEPDQAWYPSEDELIAAVQIVRSTKPRNEAEACLAAQMVAVHLIQMKLSSQALKRGWAEPRTCAVAGKLARTYAVQLETMAKLKGKGTRQRITVRKHSQHEHKHIHLHQGDLENGNQSHEPKAKRLREIQATLEHPGSAALPGPNASQYPVSMSGYEGQEEMPLARRSSRDGSPYR